VKNNSKVNALFVTSLQNIQRNTYLLWLSFNK
jgi:hypothetical protein